MLEVARKIAHRNGKHGRKIRESESYTLQMRTRNADGWLSSRDMKHRTTRTAARALRRGRDLDYTLEPGVLYAQSRIFTACFFAVAD